MKNWIYSLLFIAIISFSSVAAHAGMNMSTDDDIPMGAMPIGGGSEEADLDICPLGAKVVAMFIVYWEKEDYQSMYDLIDDESKKNYSFDQARLDFGFLEFKRYKISSIRKSGENFEFILTYGDYRDRDKDLKKMIISGNTFKIILSPNHSPFKESLEKYL